MCDHQINLKIYIFGYACLRFSWRRRATWKPSGRLITTTRPYSRSLITSAEHVCTMLLRKATSICWTSFCHAKSVRNIAMRLYKVGALAFACIYMTCARTHLRTRTCTHAHEHTERDANARTITQSLTHPPNHSLTHSLPRSLIY